MDRDLLIFGILAVAGYAAFRILTGGTPAGAPGASLVPIAATPPSAAPFYFRGTPPKSPTYATPPPVGAGWVPTSTPSVNEQVTTGNVPAFEGSVG